MSVWRQAPEPIPAEQIEKSYEADVVVVGLGYAGTAAFRAAAEAGAKTVGIEIQSAEKYGTLGLDIGHINSKFLESRGVPKVDPIAFYNEWMRRTINRANPALVMKHARNCGGSFDWFTDMLTPEELAKIDVSFWPQNKKTDGELAGYKFWTGTAQFPGWREPGHPSLTDVCKANQQKARALGAETFFGVEAMQLVKAGDRVVGVIGRDASGKFYRYNASRAVVLAAGDFSANDEMCRELLPDIAGLFAEGDGFHTMGGRSGRAVQLGVWAGGRLEAGPIATMGGNHNTLSGLASVHGILWLDPDGRRFCNENFGDQVFCGFPGNQMKHGTFFSICDSMAFEDAQWAVPQHMGFDSGHHNAGERIRNAMRAAVEAGDAGAQNGPPGSGGRLYAGDTVEQLCDRAGMTGEVRENAIKSFNRYNELCRLGRDEDFGKDSKLLRPLDRPPYFLMKNIFRMVGRMMVTCGGLLTDENQNVLDLGFERLPGLYATGNCCGRRFGPQYSTPIPGSSIAMAMTLGREAGKAAAGLG